MHLSCACTCTHAPTHWWAWIHSVFQPWLFLAKSISVPINWILKRKKRKLDISENKQMLSQHHVTSAAQTHTSATINTAVMSCPANGPDSHGEQGERGGPHVHASATHRRNFTPRSKDLFRNSTHSHRRNQYLNLGNFSLKKSRLREGRDFLNGPRIFWVVFVLWPG